MIEEKGTFEFDPEFQKMIRLPLSGFNYIVVDKNIPDEEAIKEWTKINFPKLYKVIDSI